MKKILIVCIFISISLFSSAQLVGSGTYADPWSGTLVGNTTWSGTNYINGDIIVDNEKLTISPGAIIIFLAEGADLIITGTGQLEADGTPTSLILFTSDDDNDGNYGESGERWGHISFRSMGAAGNSLINYCVIEYGYKDNGQATVESFGGGIYAGFSDLTISNTTLRYNHAGYGGGIFIKDNCSPSISNNFIHNNTVAKGGGGLFVHFGVSSVISNCLITNNRCLGSGGGGGIYMGPNALAAVLNTTIARNSTLYPSAGDNLVFSQNSLPQKPFFVNCIVWGSNSSVAYINQSPTVNDFTNCAIQNPVSGSTTNCITLNSSNTNPLGPNFVATDGSDWSIKYISPCLNAGTDSYPGVTIPPTDYAGNFRASTTDIGAFEYQYSRWKTSPGSTDWATAANWDGGVPTSSRDIIIPSGASLYPTGSSPVDVTVGSGKLFIMEPGSRATVNNLTNGGTMRLLANSTAFSSLIAASYARAGSGTEEIQVFLSGGGNIDDDDFKWHYISSPVASLPTNIFTGTTLDLAQFVESRPTISLRQGWVAFDGYIYSTGGMGGTTFNNLTTAANGKGYNYFHLSDRTYTFSGLLNTTSVTAPLGFSNNGALSGYNLLGNPFLSGLDWNYIINDPGFPLNTTKGLYFTRDNVMCSYIGGVGVPGDVTGIIPPMQGFFSKTYTTGNSIIIPVEARTHDNIHARYKGSGTIIPLVRLALTGTDLTDETVVRFDDAAKSTLDNDFDAEKFFILETKTYIYTILGAVKYTINGLPFPETTLEIPVVANVISDGLHTINASQLQGLDNYRVTLVDQQENITTDMRVNPLYSFTASKGKIENRFVLIISELISSSENIDANSGDFKIFAHNGFINVTLENDLWDGKSGTINLVDLTGRTLRQVNGIEFRTGSPVLVASPEQKGVYLVQIRSGIQRFTGKVLVK